MNAHHIVGAVAPRLPAPERPIRDDAHGPSATTLAGQAALTIEDEAYVRAYLDRLQSGTVSPDDLAVLMAFLSGEMLAGTCRLIEKALGVRHA